MIKPRSAISSVKFEPFWQPRYKGIGETNGEEKKDAANKLGAEEDGADLRTFGVPSTGCGIIPAKDSSTIQVASTYALIGRAYVALSRIQIFIGWPVVANPAE